VKEVDKKERLRYKDLVILREGSKTKRKEVGEKDKEKKELKES
jgi:hypothetical protein